MKRGRQTQIITSTGRIFWHSLPWQLALASLVVLVTGCSSEEAGAAGVAAWGGRQEVTATVETVEVVEEEFRVFGEYAGEFQSDGLAQLSAEVAGRVISTEVNIGDTVTKGQVLAVIDDTNLRQSVRELQASVAVAQATLLEAQVNVENLENDLRRRRPLLERQMVTEREIEELESGLRRAEQQVAVAQAMIEQNQARLATAQENLRNTQIRAPFDGTISERYVDRGTYISPGQPVFNVLDEGELYVTVRVPERDAPRVHRETPVEVRIGAMGSAPLKGRIHRVAPALDPMTRSLRVDVILEEEEDLYIRPGMYARLRLQLGHEEEAHIVASQAILRRSDGTPYVWAVRPDATVERRELVLGLVGSDRTQITQGLKAGEIVVSRGHEKLEEGMKIRDVGRGTRSAPSAEQAGESQ